ncbi:putative bifunctional diguanylate cyclase/phosphodiesterase [uncultured Jatrophihabitans sp.]|uniref:putative bifunctional diguanylate cyclase/phosphodiesterase n=1 Tax=uncultured Jatrophihabitans sp. TaxID=1610747 RepID=UPI0035CC7F71
MTIADHEIQSRVVAEQTPFGLEVRTDGVGAIVVDTRTRSVTADAALLTMLGLPTDQEAPPGWQLLRRVPRPDRRRLCAAVAGLTGSRRERFRVEIGAEHTHRWLEARFEVDPLDGARVTAVVIDVDDLVTKNLTLTVENAELEASDRFHRAVIAATPDAIHVYDVATGALSRVNQSDEPLFDFSPEVAAVVSGVGVEQFIPYPDRCRLDDTLNLAATLPDQQSAFIRHRVVTTSGETRWVRRRIGVLARDADGKAVSLFIASLEVTDLISAEQEFKYAATHDESTGLANRRRFMTDMEEGLRRDKQVAFAVLDIDGLRSVSDTRGRDVADALLSAVARRLRSAVRADDVVARLGDTEFGLLVTSERWDTPEAVVQAPDTDTVHIERVVDRIEELLAEPFHLGDLQLALTASAGICTDRLDGDAETMIRAANAAMDRVRRSGSGGRYTFDDALAEDIRAEENIEQNLRRALRDDALEVYYQPIVAPRTGRVCSVEALMRLPDESGRLLPVEDVIAVAERCGLVSQLDDQMLVKAGRQVAAWRRDPRYRDLQLALNRSAKDLNRAGFHTRILRALDESGLPAEALLIEVTETVLLHVASARIEEMKRLCDSQIRFAIDDFGTGYASLSQLISLPISEIKIDRSFTARILEDPTCAALVAASIRIASDLGLSCVVEGVETVEQLDALPDYGGLLVQGYLFSRPRPAGENGPSLDTMIEARLRPLAS